MNLYIYRSGGWRRVFCDPDGVLRVECGRRRRARLVIKHKNVLKEIRLPHALNHLRIGPALREFKPPKKLSLIKKNYIKNTKDACIGTSNETMQCNEHQINPFAVINGDLRSNEKDVSPRKASTDTTKKVSQDVLSPDKKSCSGASKLSGKTAQREKILQSKNFNGKASRILAKNWNGDVVIESQIPDIARATKPLRSISVSSRETVKSPRLMKSNVGNGNKKSAVIDLDKDSSQSQSSSSGETCVGKKLIISEEDVAVLRNYILKNKTKIDLYRFDSDMHYKEQIFYKINPMVRVTRSPLIAHMLQEKSEHAVTAFARRLGLHSVNSIDSDGSSDEIKESQKKRRSRRTIGHLKSSSDSDWSVSSEKNKKRVEKRNNTSVDDSETTDEETVTKNKKTDEKKRKDQKRMVLVPNNALQPEVAKRQEHLPEDKENKKVDTIGVKLAAAEPKLLKHIKALKRSSVPPGREYSMMEDHCIVAWLSNAQEREKKVSGNKIWRELETDYVALTSKKRTWQSLRNRFLRYILPELEKMALDSQHVQRLRANYATGDPVQKKKMRRSQSKEQNSLLVLPVVRSASARRPTWKHKEKDDSLLEKSHPEVTHERSTDKTKNPATSSLKRTSELTLLLRAQAEFEKSSKPTQNLSRLRKRTMTEDSSEENSDSDFEIEDKRKSVRQSKTKSAKRLKQTPLSPSVRVRPNKNEEASSPLSYSQITKRFELRKMRSTPQSDNSPNASLSALKPKATGRRLYNAAVPM